MKRALFQEAGEALSELGEALEIVRGVATLAVFFPGGLPGQGQTIVSMFFSIRLDTLILRPNISLYNLAGNLALQTTASTACVKL